MMSPQCVHRVSIAKEGQIFWSSPWVSEDRAEAIRRKNQRLIDQQGWQHVVSVESKGMPTTKVEQIRDQLRSLESAVAALPKDTDDQRTAVHRIRTMIGDQLAELTWWRSTCDTCGAYLGDKACDHGPRPA